MDERSVSFRQKGNAGFVFTHSRDDIYRVCHKYRFKFIFLIELIEGAAAELVLVHVMPVRMRFIQEFSCCFRLLQCRILSVPDSLVTVQQLNFYILMLS